MKLSIKLLAGVSCAALMSGAAMAQEAQLPAVSGFNGKVSGSAGVINDDFGVLGQGSLSLPLGHSFGVQVDGAIGEAEKTNGDQDIFGGGGGHLFWRDPDVALAGITAAYGAWGKRDIGRVGVEGELYLDQFTLAGRGGYQFGDLDDDGYALLDLQWYPDDDFMVSIGGGYEYRDAVGKARAEWQPGFQDFSGFALTVDGVVGNHGHYMALAGIRFYFNDSEPKSLIRRHREDDPVVNTMSDMINTLNNDDEDDPGMVAGTPPPPNTGPPPCATTAFCTPS